MRGANGGFGKRSTAAVPKEKKTLAIVEYFHVACQQFYSFFNVLFY
jgi:hypothetical protein